MTEAINHTRLVVFRRCRRLHKISYWDGVRPIRKAIQLLFGEAWHVWLEHWLGHDYAPTWIPPMPAHGAYDCYGDDQTWLCHEQPIEWSSVAKLEAADPFEAARFRAMVLAYHLRWRKQTWHVLAVERPYRTELVNPETGEVSDWAHRDGRIDAMIGESGQPEEDQYLVEFKSHEGPLKPGDPYFTKLRLDGQLSQYWIGSKSMGFNPAGIIYDVACKPSLDPLKATPEAKRKYTQGTPCKPCSKDRSRQCTVCDQTGWIEPPRLHANQRDRDETVGEYGLRCFQELVSNPDAYFHRVKVVRLEHEMHEYELSDWQTVEQMRRERELGHYPMNTDACWQYNRACDAWGICSGLASASDETLYTIRPRKTA